MPANNDLVLITGVSGHVGFAVLREALAKGYRVRAAVRSEAKAKLVGENYALRGLKTDNNLDFLIIPDFLIPGAFDTAVQDCTYIIHVASPQAIKGDFESANLDAEVVQPAVQATLGLLESAAKTPTVKRIVITSSGAAITPPTAWLNTSGSSCTSDTRLPEFDPPYENRLMAYVASKVAALNRAERWIEAQNPAFDAVHLFPSMVFGWDPLTQTEADLQGCTNRFIVNHARGHNDAHLPTRSNNYCLLEQVARVHVQALDLLQVPGNQGYLITSDGDDGMEYNDIDALVRKHFPEQVEGGVFRQGAGMQTVRLRVDNRKTEELFGFRHAGFEACVVDTLKGYLTWKKGGG
ncbi:NAD(P)-binding [Lecanosticta acicola]|uniref:NAD(P)-binding n=1 Tax=Lecanosticta acicola TaxID=111012 RepID=A0AAI9EEG3_9PEZI|nr:NAD(P)-binding [Lecanosticta acicola]